MSIQGLIVRDLTVEYVSGGYTIRPIDKLSFEAKDGELVVLLGPSGCGKTTLLSALAGLLRPTSGEITYTTSDVGELRHHELREYRRHTAGIIFQAFNLIPSLTARGNVMVPLRIDGMSRRDARSRAGELLELVGLGERASHRPSQMSGGQQQRVAIARALAHDPPLLLADEPTAHLDHVQVEGVLRLLRSLAAPGRTIVVATHDDRVTQLADRVIELSPDFDGQPEQPPEELYLSPGTILYEMGDRSHLVYMLNEGSLEAYRELEGDDVEIVRQIEPGDFFGQHGPLLNLPRSQSVRATQRSHVTSFTVAAFTERYPEHAEHFVPPHKKDAG